MITNRTIGLLPAALLLLSAPLAFGQEYSLFGSVTTELAWEYAELASPDTSLTVPLVARLTHAVAGDRFDLTARTRLSASGSGLALALDELALSLYPAGWLVARLGRFDVEWGAGYVFNPGNVLGAGELAGVPAVAGGSTPAGANGASMTVVASPSLTIAAVAALPTAAMSATAVPATPVPATPVPTTPVPTTADATPWRSVVTGARLDALTAGIDWSLGIQYLPDAVLRPSLGASVDLAGVIVAVDAAAELVDVVAGSPEVLVATALQYTGAGGLVSVTVEHLVTASDGDARSLLAAEIGGELVNLLSLSLGGLVAVEDGSFAARAEAALLALLPVEVYAGGELVWGPDGESTFGSLGTIARVAIGARVNL